MSGADEESGEPVAKKMRISRTDDAEGGGSDINLTGSTAVTNPIASELAAPQSHITTLTDGTTAKETKTVTTPTVTLAATTIDQEPVTQLSQGQGTTLVTTSVGKLLYSPTTLKPVAVVTTGNIRPSLQTTQSDTSVKTQVQTVQRFTAPQVSSMESPPAVQTHIRPPLQITTPGIAIPLQQTWTTDGKVTLQISNSSAIRPMQTKSPVTLPMTVASGAQKPTGPQVVTLQHRLSNPTSILAKPTTTKPVSTVETKLLQPTTQKVGQTEVKVGEQIITSPTQISFQMPMPVKWNASGSKSLLDSSNKLSVVNLNTTEPKSLLQDNKVGASDIAMTTVSTDPHYPMKIANTNTKTFVTGGKLIGSLTSGQILTQTSSGLVSVPRTGSIVTNLTNPPIQQKILINNKQYTTQVVTQIVKTDPSKAKITMAEAQIMLPSGPAKISWPVQTTVSCSESKQILITSPIIKTSPVTPSKPATSQKSSTVTATPSGKVTTVTNPPATAKVVETAGQKASSPVVSTKSATQPKMSVLPAQKNWELIKQAQHLMPKKMEISTNSNGDNVKKTLEPEDSGKKTEEKSSVDNKNAPEEIGTAKVKTEPTDKPAVVTSSDTGTDITSEDGTKDVKIKEEPEEPVVQDKISEPVAGDKQEEDVQADHIQTTEQNEEDKAIDMEVDETEVKTHESGVKMVVPVEAGKMEDFNPVNAMNWKDGVGELPGSNLKFRMNDLGVLEVITDDLECTETLNTSNESEANEIEKGEKPANTEMETDTQPKLKQEPNGNEVSNKDEISQCDNCGEYGFATDFYKDGRFCSQTCVGAFDSKRMRGVKKYGTMSKVVLGLKKGRKKLLLKDSLNRDKDLKTDAPVLAGKKNKAFVWTKYLEKEKATEAPARLFKNPFPSAKNPFRVGMKLEGIDPMHQCMFCVLTVAEVCGYRMRLHFDGYSECFDFWADVDSSYIFPVGFCEKNSKYLQHPKGFTNDNFTWANYLKLTKAIPAGRALFSNQPTQSVTPNLFRVGSKLEAVDKRNSNLICVASVADTLGDKVLIHFDSWDDNYDYWCDMTSPFIHPIGYCEENNIVLSPPHDWKDASGFTWDKYLSKTKTQAVPARAFKPRAPIGFEVGMKVEVVDKRNPLLVRVATIAEVENYMVRIHFDGWADLYDYWLDDDSSDLHPPGWCAKTGHPLVPPISPSDLVVTSGPGVCPTPGCKGIGHIKGAKYSGHHSTFGCPYSDLNMNKDCVLGDRLGPSIIKPDDPAQPVQKTTAEESPPDIKGSTSPKPAPTVAEEIPKKFGRGRRPKSYYIQLEEQKREREQDRLEKEETIRQGIHNSVFTSSMVSPSRSEVPLCWEQHSKLLPGVTNIRGNDVNKWTIEQVAAFVNTLPGCQEQAKLFQEEQIDGEAFLLLTQSDIVKIMNIKLGPALKIFNSIIMFKNSVEI